MISYGCYLISSCYLISLGYFRVKERHSAVSKITPATIWKISQSGARMEAGRPVMRFLWLSRQEMVVAWTRVVAVGSGWI